MKHNIRKYIFESKLSDYGIHYGEFHWKGEYLKNKKGKHEFRTTAKSNGQAKNFLFKQVADIKGLMIQAVHGHYKRNPNDYWIKER